MPRLLWAMALFATAATAACHKDAGPGGVRLKQVHDGLNSAGFKTDDFKKTDSSHFSAQNCEAGALSGLDTVICEFGSPEAVMLGKKAGEAWVAQATTGVVLANGNTLLYLADRGKADPNGQTIHKITKAYSGIH